MPLSVCLVLDNPLCNSPTPSPDSRKNQEAPRLSETSVKDRLAKYQAAVSKQRSSISQLVGSSFFSFWVLDSCFSRPLRLGDVSDENWLVKRLILSWRKHDHSCSFCACDEGSGGGVASCSSLEKRRILCFKATEQTLPFASGTLLSICMRTAPYLCRSL